MKAVEYFEKYSQGLLKDVANDTSEAVVPLLQELITELQELIKTRNILTVKGLGNLVEEFNNKYNTIGKLFEKTYGYEVLKRDGFKTYIKTHLTEIKL